MFVLVGLSIGACFLWFTSIAVGNISQMVASAVYFGAEWRPEFENLFGPLATAKRTAWVGGAASLAMLSVPVWWFQSNRASKRRPQPRRRVSRTELHVQNRRNALLFLYFGTPVMFFGLALCIFRWGLFAQHSTEVALGMFVLIAGYALIMAGCRYWLLAKGWNEAVMTIELLPLATPVIPFVRILIFKNLIFLWGGMVMMSLVLVVVILTLPDRSGFSR